VQLTCQTIKSRILEFAGTGVFEKIFRYDKWESVSEVQHFCGELSFEYSYDLCKWNFLSNSHVVRVQPVDLFIKLSSHLLSSLKTKNDATWILILSQAENVMSGHISVKNFYNHNFIF